MGKLRVTHPCATEVLLLPFDLHVLGTPPTFILSQDQTLRLIFDKFALVGLLDSVFRAVLSPLPPSHFPVVKLRSAG